jgi:nanoRNase/pAp phosphatase (c-di-AMP/oligoRNAs hydrolase)
MIDHHQSPDDYAEFTYSNTEFGSTCEMVYNFIAFLEQTSLIDKTVGTCLYTGILTDSGSFRYPKTTGKTHRIVAQFIELGVENTTIPNLFLTGKSDGAGFAVLYSNLSKYKNKIKAIGICSNANFGLGKNNIGPYDKNNIFFGKDRTIIPLIVETHTI